MAIRGVHHGDLDALVAHPGDATGPFAVNTHSAFERQTEFDEELDSGIDVFHHDANVVDAFDRHEISWVACGE